jgi:hypothetical protein
VRLYVVVVLLLTGCQFRVDPILDSPAARDFAVAAAADLSSSPPLPDLMPSVVIRVDVNGPAHQGIDYPGDWAADPGLGGVCAPLYYSSSATIHGTADGAMFQNEAYGSPLTCTIGHLPSGKYQVGLYFAEIYFGPGCLGGGQGTGARVFDIELEGQRVLQNFDIFSQGGCAASTTDSTGHPVVKRFEVAVTDGTLDISMPASVNMAKISAIEVLSMP